MRVLYISLLLMIVQSLHSQKIFELDTMCFSNIESGKPYCASKLSVYDGTIFTPDNFFFIVNDDTVYYKFKKLVLDVDTMSNLNLVIEYKNKVLHFFDLENMICSNSKVFISILFDFKNENDSNVVYEDNSSSCGDMFISKAPSDIESPYHIISIDSYKDW